MEPDVMDADIPASPGLDENPDDGNEDLSVLLDPPDLRHGFDPSRDPMMTTDDPSPDTPQDNSASGQVPPASPHPTTHQQDSARKQKSVMFTPGTPYGPSGPHQPASAGREFLYCTVKLSTDGKSLDDLTSRLTVVLKNLGNLNIEFQLLVYNPMDALPPVSKLDSIGSKLTQYQRYFHGIYLAKTTWSQWRVSWVSPYQGYTATHFLTDANAVLSEFNSSMYAKWLQLPFTATAGWIFKSLDHTDLVTLKLFLESELRTDHDFEGPFALYRKVPFLGTARSPSSTSNETRQASGRAIHVDTVDSLCTTLWQKLNRLLKSPAMKKLHNFEWKFVPQYHSRRSAEDQNQLKISAAKQKLVYKAIATVTCDYFLDIELPFTDQAVTLRRFFLDQRLQDQGSPIILAIDRSENNADEYVFTAAQEHREALSSLIQFSPIRLYRSFGPDIERKLSVTGIAALQDQYWDDDQNIPRSRFSDSLRDDHLDDRDIRIVFDNLPEMLAGSKRPGDTVGLDIDDITQASFTTQGHSRAKLPRFAAPSSETAEQVRRLESEKAMQDNKIAALEAQLAGLLSQLQSNSSSVQPRPMGRDDHP